MFFFLIISFQYNIHLTKLSSARQSHLVHIYLQSFLNSWKWIEQKFNNRKPRQAFFWIQVLWPCPRLKVNQTIFGWWVVFYIPSTARTFRGGTPFTRTVPCKGREAWSLHHSHWELNPGRRVAVQYTTAAPRQLLQTIFNLYCLIHITYMYIYQYKKNVFISEFIFWKYRSC